MAMEIVDASLASAGRDATGLGMAVVREKV
jgi:hypothetical protein